jgi:hypothetical protein
MTTGFHQKRRLRINRVIPLLLLYALMISTEKLYLYYVCLHSEVHIILQLLVGFGAL